MESNPPSDQDGYQSEIDRLLRALLVGDLRLKLDPATGQVIDSDTGQNSVLTDSPAGHSIDKPLY